MDKGSSQVVTHSVRHDHTILPIQVLAHCVSNTASNVASSLTAVHAFTAVVKVQAQQASSKHQASKHGTSRLLRIQKSVDDAHPEPGATSGCGRSDVELLTEIDNLKDVDRLVQLGQDVAQENAKVLQRFVRHSLFAQVET